MRKSKSGGEPCGGQGGSERSIEVIVEMRNSKSGGGPGGGSGWK